MLLNIHTRHSNDVLCLRDAGMPILKWPRKFVKRVNKTFYMMHVHNQVTAHCRIDPVSNTFDFVNPYLLILLSLTLIFSLHNAC